MFDTRFAEQAEEAPVGVVVDERLDLFERQVPHGRDATGLDARVGDGDVRIDARAGGRDGVARERGRSSGPGCTGR